MANTKQMNIQRDARVEATDGEVGWVTHVVLDPQTKEVTDLVVGHGDQEWLLPMSAVGSVEGDRVMVRGNRAAVTSSKTFNRDRYHGVDGEQVREESTHRAARGGAPLRNADDDQVEVGGRSPGAMPTPRQQGPRAVTADNEHTYHLQLREEELRARTERVEAGTVGVRTEVVEEQRTVEVPVTHEEVVIERHAVGRRPADEPIAAEGETIRVPLTEERARLEKQTVVTGEVAVGKRQVQETEHLTGTVRREDARVETAGAAQHVHDVGSEGHYAAGDVQHPNQSRRR